MNRVFPDNLSMTYFDASDGGINVVFDLRELRLSFAKFGLFTQYSSKYRFNALPWQAHD